MFEVRNEEGLAALREKGAASEAVVALVTRRLAEVVAAYAEAGAAWDPDEYGSLWLLEPADDPRDLREAGFAPGEGLIGAIWEVAVWHAEAQAWEVYVLSSNDGGPLVFVPDASWLDPELRGKLEAEAPREVEA